MGFPLEFPFPLGGDQASYPLPDHDPRGGAGGVLRRIGNHCKQSIDLLISQYQNKPRIAALICSYQSEIQAIEDAIATLYEYALSIEKAQGVALDRLGRILREARNGRADDPYRRSLRVRVLVNKSSGAIPRLIKIARLFEETADEPGAYVRIRPAFPARLEARIVRTPINPPREIHARLWQARAAGVALTTITHPGGPTGSFRFSSVGSYPEKSTSEGFARADGSNGGAFAHAIA